MGIQFFWWCMPIASAESDHEIMTHNFLDTSKTASHQTRPFVISTEYANESALLLNFNRSLRSYIHCLGITKNPCAIPLRRAIQPTEIFHGLCLSSRVVGVLRDVPRVGDVINSAGIVVAGERCQHGRAGSRDCVRWGETRNGAIVGRGDLAVNAVDQLAERETRALGSEP